MGKEIERKFLVDKQKWQPSGEKVHIRQAYLSNQPERTVRVRIAGNISFLTVKGKAEGITRAEFNYIIPVEDAEELFKLAIDTIIVKYRYKLWYRGKLWEVDEFLNENEGLLLAEVELNSASDVVVLPEWVDTEVSYDKKYFNSYLSKFPFNTWNRIK